MTGPAWRLNPSPLQPAARGQQARQAAGDALEVCAAAPPAAGTMIFTGGVLSDALDPLRLYPAVVVRCGHCENGVAYAALHPQGAYVVSANRRSKPKQRRGGIYDLDAITPTGPGTGFTGWDADARAGKGSIRPAAERDGAASGFPERRTHKCHRCGREYLHTNNSLLTKYLSAITRGDDEIRLH